MDFLSGIYHSEEKLFYRYGDFQEYWKVIRADIVANALGFQLANALACKDVVDGYLRKR